MNRRLIGKAPQLSTKLFVAQCARAVGIQLLDSHPMSEIFAQFQSSNTVPCALKKIRGKLVKLLEIWDERPSARIRVSLHLHTWKYLLIINVKLSLSKYSWDNLLKSGSRGFCICKKVRKSASCVPLLFRSFHKLHGQHLARTYSNLFSGYFFNLEYISGLNSSPGQTSSASEFQPPLFLAPFARRLQRSYRAGQPPSPAQALCVCT